MCGQRLTITRSLQQKLQHRGRPREVYNDEGQVNDKQSRNKSNLFVIWKNTSGPSFEIAVHVFCVVITAFVWIYPVLALGKREKQEKLIIQS